MAELQDEYRRKNTFLKNWGAVIILIVFFSVSWGGQFVSQLTVQKQQAVEHHVAFEMGDFWPQFLSSTFENWQSEWLQLIMQAILLAGFSSYIFRKQDEQHFKTQLMIEDLKKQLAAKK